MRRVVLGCLLAGCFTKPEAPIAGDSGVGPAPDCRMTPFPPDATELIAANSFDGAFIGDPAMSSDLLELYYTANPGQELWQIRRAARVLAGGSFVSDVDALPFLDATRKHADASITADGLQLYFVRYDSDTTPRAYYATRSSLDGDWSPAMIVPGLGNVTAAQVDISADGGTLYFVEAARTELRVARRTAERATFELDPAMYGFGTYPAVSSDGLELFYYNEGGLEVRRSIRTLTTEMFPPGELLFNVTGDPDLLPNSQTLVVWSPGTPKYIRIHTRVCPPGP